MYIEFKPMFADTRRPQGRSDNHSSSLSVAGAVAANMFQSHGSVDSMERSRLMEPPRPRPPTMPAPHALTPGFYLLGVVN